MKQALEECGTCKKRDSRLKKYDEEVEREKTMECQKALEREKIANGIKWTKEDEIQLRMMQRMQMEEKKRIEEEWQEIDKMWHKVLEEDVRQKELKERLTFRKKQQEMAERRLLYDEQIASANRRRNEVIREERDKENRRLERINKKMEKDHLEAIKRKKEQQLTNKLNYIEGHEAKFCRLQQQKKEDRATDDSTIRVALEELMKERQRQRLVMQKLQKEKQIFIENYNRERRTASALDEESERIALEWKREEENRADEFSRRQEMNKIMAKEKAAEEYNRHLEEQRQAKEKERQVRATRMERVRERATNEMKRRFVDAHEELRRQMEYRDSLTRQIEDNMKVMNTEKHDIELRQEPFTKRPQMFKDLMDSKIDRSPGRLSTNPVHPFKRLMDSKNLPYLPSLYGCHK